jgi:hypothetical protein
MIVIICIGLFFILLSGIINIMECMRFFKALGILNKHTRTLGDKLIYPIRFICLLPLLWRILPDVIFMTAAGSIGLGGGVMGSVIAMGGTCAITLMIKIALRMTKPKDESHSYKNELNVALGRE